MVLNECGAEFPLDMLLVWLNIWLPDAMDVADPEFDIGCPLEVGDLGFIEFIEGNLIVSEDNALRSEFVC